jgi:hypothetical protein
MHGRHLAKNVGCTKNRAQCTLLAAAHQHIRQGPGGRAPVATSSLPDS